MKNYLRAFLLPVVLSVGLLGCAGVAKLASDAIVSTTSAGPAQARTVGDAIRITKLVEDGLDLYVTQGSPPAAVLDQLNILVPALHNTLKKAEAAQQSGNSALIAAALAAFNESLAAVHAYETLKGVQS